MNRNYNRRVNKDSHMEHNGTIINIYTIKKFDQIQVRTDMPKALIAVVPM